MAHYSLTRFLKSAFHAALQDDVSALAEFNEWKESRRLFLKQAALVATGALLTPPLLGLASCNDKKDKSIAIIGAGIAGLNAAYQLQKKGISATVYEASGRIGGRMYTMNNEFGPGITTDIGGEFVDNNHKDIIDLVSELGLSFYHLKEDKLAHKTFYFGGKLLNDEDLKNAIQPFASQIWKDFKSLPEIVSYHAAAQFEQLDRQSITGYIKSIGITGWLYDFLNVTLTREYGMEASEQSAVNFLIMFTPPVATEKEYELFGPDHEVLKIKGGSQHLTNALYEKVKGSVKTGYKLKAISKGSVQGYDLAFDQNEVRTTINADMVLVAIPFTMVRQLDFNVPMPTGKRKCIDEIGYGNSCKFIVGVSDKPWRNHGSKGYTFTDMDFGAGWDSSQMQSEKEGSFTVFGGGNFGDKVLNGNDDVLTGEVISSVNTIYPGMDKAFNHRTKKFCWVSNPYSKAAYSSFKAGQWSTLAGWEGVPVEQIYFAGEHVSREFQGYMNGGAQTGKAAVELMMKSIAQHS
ncbi:MAG: FAD-dependent oxidoreductase [Bacteroidota bacterium]|nr:FAD-dependent oxidoreductase [Bacteroidota bacterium]